MPGGPARVCALVGSRSDHLQRGGLEKDIWVLCDARRRALALCRGSAFCISYAADFYSPLGLWKLFWMGPLAERVENIVRLCARVAQRRLKAILGLSLQFAHEPGRRARCAISGGSFRDRRVKIKPPTNVIFLLRPSAIRARQGIPQTSPGCFTAPSIGASACRWILATCGLARAHEPRRKRSRLRSRFSTRSFPRTALPATP